MSEKVIVGVNQGLGNIFQCLPVCQTLFEHGYQPYLMITSSSYNFDPSIIPFPVIDTNIENNDYDHLICTYDAFKDLGDRRFEFTEILTNSPDSQRFSSIVSQERGYKKSEVKLRLEMLDRFDINESEYSYSVDLNVDEVSNPYDIVMINGYNHHDKSVDWSKKTCQYFDIVASEISKRGYSICSVGSHEDEYIICTDDMTGLSLRESLNQINSCRLVICNDTGLYHAANLLNKENLVVFSFTDVRKSFDEHFHDTSTTLFIDNLSCRRNCQVSNRWIKCNDLKCRRYNPSVIIDFIETKLGK